MSRERDYGAELDSLKAQMAELKGMIQRMIGAEQTAYVTSGAERTDREAACAVYFSGYFRQGSRVVRCEAREKRDDELFGLGKEKAAKVIAALGHKQRLDLLMEVWNEPLTGAELVERLNMGTTGQLYHHLKALTGADLLSQEERGGRYSIPDHRRLPILLLLAAVSDLMDTGDYIEMAEARNEAHSYLGAAAKDGYDLHQLLWAVLNNSLQEHQEGYCTEIGIYLHDDGSVTVADNGRGIPTRLLPQTGQPAVQSVLTKLDMFRDPGQDFVVPGAEKGISIAVVNALSRKLHVEIRRDGEIYRQEYRHGIPQTGLMTVGKTNETGTRVTILPDAELFAGYFDRKAIEQRIEALKEAFSGLRIYIQGESQNI